jgi:C1A family cysteine protease
VIRTLDFRSAQTAVRDQGERQACVGFAVSAAHEWMGSSETRSPEDALWAAHQIGGPPGVEATQLVWALQGLAVHSHASETSWPFGNPPWPANRPAAAGNASEQRTLPPWSEIARTFAAAQDELSAGLAVLLSLWFVTGAWDGRTGVIDAPPGRVTRTGHAVLAVGTANLAGVDTIIVKNSWGPGWGAAGYGQVTRDYLESYLKRAFVLGRS